MTHKIETDVTRTHIKIIYLFFQPCNESGYKTFPRLHLPVKVLTFIVPNLNQRKNTQRKNTRY